MMKWSVYIDVNVLLVQVINNLVPLTIMVDRARVTIISQWNEGMSLIINRNVRLVVAPT
jgi:hypothetical protein